MDTYVLEGALTERVIIKLTTEHNTSKLLNLFIVIIWANCALFIRDRPYNRRIL